MARKKAGLIEENQQLVRFQCAGHVVDVYHDTVPVVGDLGAGLEDDGPAGTTRVIDKEVLIAPELIGTVRQDTELHEVIHMIDVTFGLGLKHRQIYALGSAIQQFLSTCVYEEVDE